MDLVVNTKNILEIKGVTKLYSNRVGIKNVSFSLKAGDIVAIIGPNGAGKTTLVRSICGLNDITEGEILFNNTPVYQCRSQIGYMQENMRFYEKMTVYEILEFLCKVKFYGKYYEEIDSYLWKYGLYNQRNMKITKLSLGMKRKLALIMATIGDPKILLLDEPTNGIDTAGIIQLKQDLINYKHQNKIIIVTTHVLEWAEKLCTRTIFLKDGKIVGDYLLDNSNRSLEELYEELYRV